LGINRISSKRAGIKEEGSNSIEVDIEGYNSIFGAIYGLISGIVDKRFASNIEGDLLRNFAYFFV
jgi:hypothetical protein